MSITEQCASESRAFLLRPCERVCQSSTPGSNLRGFQSCRPFVCVSFGKRRRFPSHFMLLPVAPPLLGFIRSPTGSAVGRSLSHHAELRSQRAFPASAVTFRRGSVCFLTALRRVTTVLAFNMFLVSCSIITVYR